LVSNSSAWRPLSERDEPATEETLYEGVPPHLAGPLSSWIARNIGNNTAVLIALRLRLDLQEIQSINLSNSDKIRMFAEGDARLHLNVLDAALFLLHGSDPMSVADLESALEAGGSAWRVASDGRSLERRVDETVRMAAKTAAAPGTSAATHLAAAWQAIYGRSPNPSRAFSESIKAVEAAAIPVVSPANAKATLGTVIRDLENQQARWRLAVAAPSGTDPIAPLLGMLRLLWQGQTDRHGSGGPTVAPSAEAAAAAVHLAATLVQWFRAGVVSRSR
jgi:hypothetical protein